MLCALIMAGGKGTRFWPLSTEEKPKQFLKLIGDRTMIQMTVDRIKPIIPVDRIFVCTGKKYVDLVKEQLPDISERNIIIEPEGRNTTPCITLSALIIQRYYQDSNMIVLPSDHLIEHENRFRQIIKDADKFISNNKESIITLGMTPTRVETGYGYIKYTELKEKINESEVIKVDSFVEKPDKEKAEKYLKDGSYLWNGGMFLWNTHNIIVQIKKYSPDTYEALHYIGEVEESKIQDLINKNYSKTEAISIDYSVLEKAENIYVIPSDINWDDIGTWRAVERYKDKDENNNIINEKVRAIKSESNMAINNDKRVVMIGVRDIMTVETEDTIFIVNKKYMDVLKSYEEDV